MKTIIKILGGLLAAHLVLTQVIPRVFAVFNKTPNATVALMNCDTDTCTLKGTLKTNPLTLEYYIEQKDGTLILFNNENIQLISWPVNHS